MSRSRRRRRTPMATSWMNIAELAADIQGDLSGFYARADNYDAAQDGITACEKRSRPIGNQVGVATADVCFLSPHLRIEARRQRRFQLRVRQAGNSWIVVHVACALCRITDAAGVEIPISACQASGHRGILAD